MPCLITTYTGLLLTVLVLSLSACSTLKPYNCDFMYFNMRRTIVQLLMFGNGSFAVSKLWQGSYLNTPIFCHIQQQPQVLVVNLNKLELKRSVKGEGTSNSINIPSN